jgi:hypothetical protein
MRVVKNWRGWKFRVPENTVTEIKLVLIRNLQGTFLDTTHWNRHLNERLRVPALQSDVIEITPQINPSWKYNSEGSCRWQGQKKWCCGYNAEQSSVENGLETPRLSTNPRIEAMEC